MRRLFAWSSCTGTSFCSFEFRHPSPSYASISVRSQGDTRGGPKNRNDINTRAFRRHTIHIPSTNSGHHTLPRTSTLPLPHSHIHTQPTQHGDVGYRHCSSAQSISGSAMSHVRTDPSHAWRQVAQRTCVRILFLSFTHTAAGSILGIRGDSRRRGNGLNFNACATARGESNPRAANDA